MVGAHREDHQTVQHPATGPIAVDCDVLSDGDAERKIVVLIAAPTPRGRNRVPPGDGVGHVPLRCPWPLTRMPETVAFSGPAHVTPEHAGSRVPGPEAVRRSLGPFRPVAVPATARQAVPPAAGHGISSSFPVVVRDSMSAWALAASASG
ncbi:MULTISPECIES: hypothetical protein [Streptomyces]|uniref:hypothetical protein n=1 Tax=Streptomyces TaxID=1883 RepID=UPI001E2DEC2B|nr:hypothetical protein [Streptomyces ruber]